jgi:hypothetical protein
VPRDLTLRQVTDKFIPAQCSLAVYVASFLPEIQQSASVVEAVVDAVQSESHKSDMKIPQSMLCPAVNGQVIMEPCTSNVSP